MPWDKSDAKRFKKYLKPADREKWAKTANAVLRDTGDEGRAIRIANASVGGKKNRGKR